MRLEQSFDVAAPVGRVWQALIDIEKVAPCLPGAAVTGRNEDGSYDGTFTVKIGPTSASYAGKLLMEDVDEATHTATMQANGTDKRGQGSAKASIVSTLRAADDNRTHVEVETDYHITGRLARFGRGGMIEDISERLLRQFAERLQGMLEGPGDGAPTQSNGGAAPDRSETASGEETAEARSDEAATGEQPGEHGSSRDEPGSATSRMTQPMPSEPVEGLSLVGSVMWDRARRSPAPFAFVAGILLAFILLGRRRR
jgi:carbon monoxide dehydrogenase subunit G